MLDPAGRAAVLDLLRALHAQGTTLITITHEMEEAAEAGRVIVLYQGRVVLDGPPHAVFKRAAELREYGLDVPPIADLSLRLGLPLSLTAAELVAALEPFSRPESVENPNQPLVPAAGNSAEDHITIQGLRHTYLRGTPLAVEALRGVDLRVERGSVVGLIGETGSGKSTLMQHLNGLMRPQAGSVVVDGTDLADPSADVKAVRKKVGLLFQQPEDQLFERYLGDDVAFGPRQMKLDPAEVRERVRAAMQAVGLPFETFKDRLTQTLSGGERRRAALAGVLALRPQILVADEPTAGLDPRGRAEILGIFRRINQEGVTLVMGSHRMEDILALSDTVVALRHGQVAAYGPVREVLNQPENIQQHGLPVLSMAVLASRLRSAGWPVPPGALSASEIAGSLAEAGVRGSLTTEDTEKKYSG